MPKSHTNTTSGTKTVIPDYPEAADGPKAFAEFADSIDVYLPPVGSILPFAGAVAPAGWLMCDGNDYETSDHPKLSAVLNGRFGTVGSRFKVPDLRGRGLFGYSGGISHFDTLGKTGGNLKIPESALPKHSHTGTVTVSPDTSTHSHGEDSSTQDNTATAHTHGAGFREASNFTRSGTGVGLVPETSVSQMVRTSAAGLNSFTHAHTIHAATVTHQHTATVTISDAGSTTPTDFVSPYITLNFIIRAA